jgi:hypothetical protein
VKRLRLLALVLAAGAFFAGPAHGAYVQPIYVVNESSVITDAELRDTIPVFQQALDQDFAPVWNLNAKLIVTDNPPAGGWTVTIEDEADVVGALGYHDITAGVPYARIFANTSIVNGYSWTVTASHEIEEMLADPTTDRAVRVQRKGYPFYMLEVGDPVEGDQFGYFRTGSSGKGILLTDFVTPAWFRAGSKGPWDFTHHTKRALQIITDGYQIAWSSREARWLNLCAGNHIC